MQSFDVIIAGGGPGGLSAAEAAAKAGASVLVLEQNKEIGSPARTTGGSFVQDMKALGIPESLYHPIRRCRYISPHNSAAFEYDEPVTCVLDVRGAFQFLAERAIDAGARISVGTVATEPVLTNGAVTGVRAKSPTTQDVLSGNTIALCYLVAVLTVGTFLLHAATPMPPPTGERGFKLSEAGQLLGRPILFLLSLLLFLYVTCEVGVWNWLPRHLVAQGIPESRALGILSLGFALGLLVGRVVVSRILIKVSSPTVTLAASILMAVTTYAMLQTKDPFLAGILVFCAGLAMAPVFPTTLAMVGDAFPRMTATAMGLAITCGWIGLAVSSRIIGAIAGNDPSQLKTALLVIPLASVLMVLVTLVIRPMLAQKRARNKA